MQPGTFSRRGIAVWQQESPSLQGGEDVNLRNQNKRKTYHLFMAGAYERKNNVVVLI
jgi:hypothetical protein